MPRRNLSTGSLIAVTLLWPVATLHAASPPDLSATTFAFPTGVTFKADFPSARLCDCRQLPNGEYQAVISPENSPINNSPWYAFQVASEKPQQITVRLSYTGGSHRYRPKISRDGVHWTALEGDAYHVDKQSRQAVLVLRVDREPLLVAAQEMIGEKELGHWAASLAKQPFAKVGQIGRSVEGRSITSLSLGRSDVRPVVFIIGRQHPPEVTGSLALMTFVDTLAGPSPLARRFRDKVLTVVVPLMNPDGVAAGNWRSNARRVDMNRDWRSFAQPETTAVRDYVEQLVGEGKQLRLWLDFHSTGGDVFYTQTDDEPTEPAGFTKNWLTAISERQPDYKLRRVSSHGPTLATSTNWARRTFNIAAITYEVGDNTDRALIQRIAKTAAEEMMRLVLVDATRLVPAQSE